VADAASPPSGDELAPLAELARRVQQTMLERGLSLTTAESCTGGLIGHLLTDNGGSSEYYIGGLISYSDQLKSAELGVERHVLEQHGAVSAQAGVAMAEGARGRYRADVAVAVTGIAGPGGGSEQKPVGLTYVAVADAAGHDVRRHVFHEDRQGNKVRSAEAVLTLLLDRLGTTQG
jgi:PncC family amidohydrolase